MNIMNVAEIKKGAWSPEEDQKLSAYVQEHGSKNWCKMPQAAGLARSGKSCRLRWVNYLRPDLKGGRLTMDEIETITRLHKSLGNRWTQIAAYLPGRTDNEIKNFWHLNLKKCSRTAKAKNPLTKSNKRKLENRKENEENALSLSSYASDELYSSSTSSSIISESIDFPIAESYSPGKHSCIVSPTVSQSDDSFQGQFWIEDICIPEFENPGTFDYSPESTSSLEVDESTSLWMNILMDAERLGGK